MTEQENKRVERVVRSWSHQLFSRPPTEFNPSGIVPGRRAWPISINRLAMNHQWAYGTLKLSVVNSFGNARDLGEWDLNVLGAAYPFGYPLSPPVTVHTDEDLIIRFSDPKGAPLNDAIVFYVNELS